MINFLVSAKNKDYRDLFYALVNFAKENTQHGYPLDSTSPYM